ncbi:MAG TPA: di-heme oxidoredictase family protein [Pirellulaceae bacterium]|nr:di-heme oxidoredictase family protein [Pirellulaceae bacterium]
MRSLNRCRWLCLPIALALVAPVARGDEEPSPVQEGRQLFERKFTARNAGNLGDGLGPLFNHVSCAACHVQGGLGGGGPVDVNVVLLSAGLRSSRPEKKQLLAALREQHPNFVSRSDDISATIILHRFSNDPAYEVFRSKFVLEPVPLDPTAGERRSLQQSLARTAEAEVKTPPPLRLVTTQRNTTALFGAGLIDSIPDGMLRTLAQEQQSEVSGRVPPIGFDRVGRFGWRGQIETLHDFVLGACANELGLEVPGHEQPRDPQRPKYRPVGLDLSASECRSLTAFVAQLPAPRMVLPADPDKKALAEQGRDLFGKIGCAACHVERIGPVQGIYSDLLLHDLGEALTDPAPAEATFVATGKRLPPTDESILGTTDGEALKSSIQPQPPRPRGYNGGSQSLVAGPSVVLVPDKETRERIEFRAQPTPVESEWRTPPLWGVADSAPYLHDGRAASLVEAIALHGGEAEPCTKRFFAQSLPERLAVLEFLGCLRAPQ